MTSTEKTVLSLIQASLFPRSSAAEETIPLDTSVFTEMKVQAIAALPQDYLKNHPIADPDLRKNWTQYIGLLQAQWVRVMHGQKQLLDLLEANGIPCVILKGAAAGMAYPHPSLRSMGDVDFLVHFADREKAAELLEANGYTLAHEKDLTKHHFGYSKNGVEFELHWRIPLVSETDEKWMSVFERGIDDREWHETDGYRFPAFPRLPNGLVLIFHIDQHLRSGLGLRQIIDWMMYVNGLSEKEWEALLPLLRDAGVETLALTVNAMCERYLGFQKHLSRGAEPAVCDKLMALTIEKGNFGRKAGIEGRTAEFTLSSTGKGSFFKRLQKGGLCHWKAAEKHKFLRPFAWLYQSFRITGIFLRSGMTPKRFMAQRRKGIEQRELVEALGLRIDRTIHRT